MSNNHVELKGTLSKELSVTSTSKGLPLARFTLVVENDSNKDKVYKDYINCSAFGKIAEGMGKNSDEGTSYKILGRLQSGKYEKQGVKVSTTNVVVESYELLQSKEKESTDDDGWDYDY